MKKILILNNHEDTMSLIKQFLQKHSFAAEYMYRADDINVIEKVQKYQPDLVILESGIGPEGAMCQRIQNSTSSHIPVILMGGNIAADKEREDCGADDVIPKPFEPKTLLKKINRLFGNYR